MGATPLLVKDWSDQEVVAGTILGEASGELWGGQIAVACVIRNRVLHPRWWGGGWREVSIKDWQFSCWKDQERRICDNRAKNSPYWQTAMRAARVVMDNEAPDVTLACDHYYAWRTPEPYWAKDRFPVIEIGAHRFYRLEIPSLA